MSRALLLHDFADRLDEEEGAFDVDVEESFEFGNFGVCYLSWALYADLQASGRQSLVSLKKECNADLTPALDTA